jgi:hypothetical protein
LWFVHDATGAWLVTTRQEAIARCLVEQPLVAPSVEPPHVCTWRAFENEESMSEAIAVQGRRTVTTTRVTVVGCYECGAMKPIPRGADV